MFVAARALFEMQLQRNSVTPLLVIRDATAAQQCYTTPCYSRCNCSATVLHHSLLFEMQLQLNTSDFLISITRHKRACANVELAVKLPQYAARRLTICGFPTDWTIMMSRVGGSGRGMTLGLGETGLKETLSVYVLCLKL
jgi:hypothetical protein